MKSTFIIATMLAGASSLMAQEQTPFRFSIEAGVNISNLTQSDHVYRVGYYAGARGEYHFSKNFYGAAALQLTQKGMGGYDEDVLIDASSSCYMGYLQLPLYIGFGGQLNPVIRGFVETGPYFAVGIYGKDKGSSYSGGPDYRHSWDNDFFSEANDNPRRFEPGWGIRIGLDIIRHVRVTAGYEIGLTEVWDKSSNRNTSFSVGLGYTF